MRASVDNCGSQAFMKKQSTHCSRYVLSYSENVKSNYKCILIFINVLNIIPQTKTVTLAEHVLF